MMPRLHLNHGKIQGRRNDIKAERSIIGDPLHAVLLHGRKCRCDDCRSNVVPGKLTFLTDHIRFKNLVDRVEIRVDDVETQVQRCRALRVKINQKRLLPIGVCQGIADVQAVGGLAYAALLISDCDHSSCHDALLLPPLRKCNGLLQGPAQSGLICNHSASCSRRCVLLCPEDQRTGLR